MDFFKVLGSLQYLWMIFFIMIFAGLAKEHNLFAPVFAYVRNTFKSNKFVLVMLSAIGGILPIEGRVTVSAGLLDTVAPKEPEARQKYGIVDYLATHHYYMWSPLEKTVVLPIAAFGLTFTAWILQILPLLVVSIGFIAWYIYSRIKDDDIHISPGKVNLGAVIRNFLPFVIALGSYIAVGGQRNVFIIFGSLALYYMFLTQTWDYKKLLGYVNWEVLFTVGAVIVLGAYFQEHAKEFQEFMKGLGVDPTTFLGMLAISVSGFMFSFLMGSSGKFVAMSILMAQIFGVEYFLWFFAIDFAGYLVSPTHKCTMVGNRYFGTPFGVYYKALGTWVALLLGTAGLFTFVL